MIIGFDPVRYNIDENGGFVVLTVRILSGVLAGQVNVQLNTKDGSALSGVDYINPGVITLHFDSGTVELVVAITILDDGILETQENFFSNLISFDRSVIINPETAEVFINEGNNRMLNITGILSFCSDRFKD